MISIEFKSRIYTHEDLRERVFSEDLSGYERNILEFSASWLNQEQHSYVLHTSGSTGIPKEITIKRDQMTLSARMTQKALGLKENDRALVCLNTDFIAGKMMLVRGLVIGMHLKIIPPSSNPFLTIDPEEKFDFTAMVPLQVTTIFNDTPEQLNIFNPMKAVILGGAPVSTLLEDQIQKLDTPFYLTFGMTETVSHIALKRLNGKGKKDYFEALDQVFLKSDERGCLVIESPLTDDPIITNDLIDLLDEKRFVWKGRVDQVINSGGIKIFPDSVERKLEPFINKLTSLPNYFIAPLPDDKFGEKVCLFVEGKHLNQKEKDELKVQVSEAKLAYESPKEIFFIEEFSMTPSGKINRIGTLQKFLDI